jgi:hypothetical protein
MERLTPMRLVEWSFAIAVSLGLLAAVAFAIGRGCQ